MIPNGEGQEAKFQELWRYLAVKKLSALLRAVTFKCNGDFYCLNFLHSFRTKKKLESHKRVCKNKEFWNMTMPSEDTGILEFIQYQKSDKHHLVFMQISNV